MGRWRAPTGAGSSSRTCAKPTTPWRTWPSPRSATRTPSTTRSRTSSGRGASVNENRDTQLSPRLSDIKKEIEGYARGFGLDFYETIFEVLGYDEINMVAAYGDFFKNNFSFRHTNRKMMDEMANHATRVRRIIDKVGLEPVETFIDRSLSLENLIDQHSQHFQRRSKDKDEEEKPIEVRGFKADREYMQGFINPREFLDEQRKKLEDERAAKKKFPERPQRDVLQFLLDHAPLERWEGEILSLMREEAYYFAPQGQTKIANEGWACILPNSLVFSAEGLEPMGEVGKAGRAVSDGENLRRVYDRNVIPDQPTIAIRTRRGLKLAGSENHRILSNTGEWVRLDHLQVGSRVRVAGGADVWPQQRVRLNWTPPRRMTQTQAAELAGVSLWTFRDVLAGAFAPKNASRLSVALSLYDSPANAGVANLVPARRVPVAIPDEVNPDLGAFLGYLIGDGHISRVKHHLGLTTADEECVEHFTSLVHQLFGLRCVVKWDDGRYRVLAHSENASDFLVEALSLTHGASARQKQVPEDVLRSPKEVVAPFLRAYFDCDGYAGKQGVILSTSSETMGEQVQL